jgi:hypothetical protein
MDKHRSITGRLLCCCSLRPSRRDMLHFCILFSGQKNYHSTSLCASPPPQLKLHPNLKSGNGNVCAAVALPPLCGMAVYHALIIYHMINIQDETIDTVLLCGIALFPRACTSFHYSSIHNACPYACSLNYSQLMPCFDMSSSLV